MSLTYASTKSGEAQDRVIWVFHGEGARFSAGVFSTRESAERWIAEYELTGLLTAYPLDCGVYDWVREQGYFTPERSVTPEFVSRFNSAYQEHYHYVRGANSGLVEEGE